MKIYLDPGHGGSDPGAVGNGLKEKDVVLDIAKRIKLQLTEYIGVHVKLSRTKDAAKSLAARTDEANAWGADIFLSIHCNAFNGRARGYEDFVYNRLSPNAAARRYREILHKKITGSIQLPNRGKKQANFHVLRETVMPAILTENGFIDHSEDARLMKQAAWREEVAKGHTEGLVEIFQLKKSTQKHSVYTVIAGSFQYPANAEGRKAFLEAKGIASQIQQVKAGQKIMYRVQAGTFPTRNAAEKQLKIIKNTGIEGFILK
ncbi:N-acetylmuramoyl-L-alanine amidase [Ralstonia pickettii]|nr:N-acetylmuramoyl-L-alanine amidase [Ralstonia pickettii]